MSNDRIHTGKRVGGKNGFTNGTRGLGGMDFEKEKMLLMNGDGNGLPRI